ncbi:lysophospholipase L1-like esterase [Paenibacillus sp. BK033]|uniref:GDSL-type esterase/lipase family protein n=1 Tax=Paenibacillus sp. BK033 TaxID=2512133 RepID=UPI00104D2532|nr:GDSL-type esterase/lipase family protein [Paenibacillus sp. BK033]TCM87928.1 lysophospholipase L1-like esterase [Paenibacillus sp. BK033]
MKLVLFGDSITARTEGHDRPLLTIKLEDKLSGNWHIINAGIPGNNTFDALNRVKKDVILHNPDLVTVLFGANDAAFHKMVPLNVFERNLTNIVTAITPSKTILISPTPVDEELQHARTNTVLKQYTEIIRAVSEATGSHYIDLFSSMINLDNLSEILRGLRNDGLHFGELGYDYLADMICRELIILSREMLS